MNVRKGIKMRKVYTLLSIFLTMLILMQGIGCAAQKAYKRGLEYETQQEVFLAAESYIEALSHKPKNVDYRVALKRVAKAGYDSMLLVAQTSQKNQDFPKAVNHYKKLKWYTKNLNKYDALTFEIIDVDQYISNVSNAAAEEKYKEGISNQKANKYQQSIKDFKMSLAFVENYKDCQSHAAVE